MKNKKLKSLENKKIAILGLGIENYALVKYLLDKKVNCTISIADERREDELGEKYRILDRKNCISWKLGANAHKNLDGFDILFRSPGWPIYDERIKEAVKMGVKLSSPMKLFFALCPTHKIIGVTGTKGKGTTASLIYNILKLAGRKVFIGGNIGIAPFSFLQRVKKNDWVVLELSSFQLEDIDKPPHIAVITNFKKEHLAPADPSNPNCHLSMQSYWQAKQQIIANQKRYDYAIINRRLALRVSKHKPKSKIIYFKKSDLESRLIGEHNKENIAAAIAAAEIARVKYSIIEFGVKRFKGLEHRIKRIKNARGAIFYNDSFATTPDATITAIRSFYSPIILLAGGADKGSDFKPLVKSIKKRVKFIVLFRGMGTTRLRKSLTRANYPVSKMKFANSMKEAVKTALKKIEEGDIVLLSPACASFGIFKNYKERGELFKKEVKRLK